MQALPIGISDFERIVTGGFYYVDKSLLMKELLTRKTHVTLIPRPRRFGKTLNLSMLRYFFEKTDTSKAHLFQHLAIQQYPECMEHQGKYPVIFLTFKDIKYSTWTDCYNGLLEVLREEYTRHSYLKRSPALEDSEKERIAEILI